MACAVHTRNPQGRHSNGMYLTDSGCLCSQLGLAKQAFTPVGRGFNTSLGYLGGAEEHYNHTAGGIDLYASNKPALGYAGIYSAYMYSGHASSLIMNHPQEKGLFMYVAFSDTHEPIEAPDCYDLLR